ncbi:hypothetical protein K144316041_p20640 (plasmid) [Clostridium tetani]|uniref:hypothetical protein n=1 Tax=Clostridium tetani TaxID=1513 RepID=UPI0029542522|nr:hypothetical protein [Clostridium tetani]BDR74225.1 hypothetical protein K144316041_p20640 [Clostridium tetani]
MDNNIKGIELVLENCEVINIPIECIKKLDINIKDINVKNNSAFIDKLEMTIENNGKICSHFNKCYNPISRLNDYNDITAITYIYKDNKKTTFKIDWVFKSDNPYAFESENQAQTSIMVNYKTIHININPNNVKYSMEDLFDFPVGSKFKTKDGQIVEIEEDIDNEKEIRLTKSMVDVSFYKVN